METDEEIYVRYMKKDDDADLEALLEHNREGLLLFLMGFTHNEQDAEDLLMDTFAKLAVDKPAFTPVRQGSFKSWLYTIARRNALMYLRKNRFRMEELDEEMPDSAPLPDVSLLEEERNRKLYKAMSRLKPDYRRVLYLLYIEELSHDEIALVCGMSKHKIYNLVKRGKESLRKTLEEMGIYDAGY